MSQLETTTVPAFGQWRTVGRLCLDTNAVIGLDPDASFPEAEREALLDLVELHRGRRVLLARTDVVDRERPAGRREAFDLAVLFDGIDLLEVWGPVRFAAERANTADLLPVDVHHQTRLNDIVVVRDGRSRINDLRDAEHLATAIRYGFDGFVTTDDRLLQRAARLRAEFGSFRVMTPRDAVAWIGRALDHRAQFWASWGSSD